MWKTFDEKLVFLQDANEKLDLITRTIGIVSKKALTFPVRYFTL